MEHAGHLVLHVYVAVLSKIYLHTSIIIFLLWIVSF